MTEQFIHVPSTDTETDPVQDPTGSDSLTGTEQELAALVDTSESSSASEDADVWEDDDHVDEDEEDEDEEDWEEDDQFWDDGDDELDWDNGDEDDDDEFEEDDEDDEEYIIKPKIKYYAPDVNPYGPQH